MLTSASAACTHCLHSAKRLRAIHSSDQQQLKHVSSCIQVQTNRGQIASCKSRLAEGIGYIHSFALNDRTILDGLLHPWCCLWCRSNTVQPLLVSRPLRWCIGNRTCIILRLDSSVTHISCQMCALTGPDNSLVLQLSPVPLFLRDTCSTVPSLCNIFHVIPDFAAASCSGKWRHKCWTCQVTAAVTHCHKCMPEEGCYCTACPLYTVLAEKMPPRLSDCGRPACKQHPIHCMHHIHLGQLLLVWPSCTAGWGLQPHRVKLPHQHTHTVRLQDNRRSD